MRHPAYITAREDNARHVIECRRFDRVIVREYAETLIADAKRRAASEFRDDTGYQPHEVRAI